MTLWQTYQNSGRRLPDSPFNLRRLYGPVENQGQLGACSAFGALQWLAALQVQVGHPWVEYSELADYYMERVLDGTVGQDSGATMRDAIQVIAQWGAMPEADDPYVPTKFTTPPPSSKWDRSVALKPSQVFYIDATNRLGDTLDALANNHPVLFLFKVFAELSEATCANTGILTMPRIGSQPQGGHFVNAIGVDPTTKMILCLNSWGPDWGIKSPEEYRGCFWMPWSYYERYCTDAVTGSVA